MPELDNKTNSRWQTVRVFISSTFRDMHAERDHLVKVVFPALRDKLEQYRVYLIDIDLRWGVTKEQADNDQVLDLCLQQIDECRPFFVSILGERYGWVPRKFHVEAFKKYGWIQHVTGKSLTELEILHGVLNNPEMRGHAFFYFRDSNVLKEIPDDIRKEVYIETAPDLWNKLKSLKELIRNSGYPVLESYPAKWDTKAYDRPTKKYGRLVGLETFGNTIREQLWEAIKTELKLPDKPPLETEIDPQTIEQDSHNRFIELHTRFYVERDEIHNDLLNYINGSDYRPCIVTGASGTGKSSILSWLCHEYDQRNPGVLLIPYFIGASPASTSLQNTLRYLCNVLKSRFDFKLEIPSETQKLITTFRTFLFTVPENRRLILVVDGINQFDETDHPEELAWLPEQLAPNVKILLSCIDDPVHGQRALERAREMNILEKKIEPLSDKERLEIISKVPSVSAKTLDDDQINMLTQNTATKNPLYLLIALEELRGFGSFEELNQRISAFPKPDDANVKDGDIIQAIFSQVIERLKQEFNGELVKTSLSLLACARRGLSEKELQDLVSGLSVKEDLFPVLRQLRLYLVKRGELIDFFHRGLWKAINSLYLKKEETKKAYHLQLADYFERYGLSLKIVEFPWQLQQAMEWERLKFFLSDIEVINWYLNHNEEHELWSFWRSISALYDITKVYTDALVPYEKMGLMGEHLARIVSTIAAFLQKIGRYEDALKFHRHSVEICLRDIGSNKLATAISLNNLGQILLNMEDFYNGEIYLRRALEIVDTIDNPDFEAIAWICDNLAWALREKGDYKGAVQLCRRALNILEENLGSNHLDTSRILNNLALALAEQKNYMEAESLLRQALKIRQLVVGPQHPSTANTLWNLACVLHAKGDIIKAEEISEFATKIMEETIGKDHPTTIKALYTKGIIYKAHK